MVKANFVDIIGFQQSSGLTFCVRIIRFQQTRGLFSCIGIIRFNKLAELPFAIFNLVRIYKSVHMTSCDIWREYWNVGSFCHWLCIKNWNVCPSCKWWLYFCCLSIKYLSTCAFLHRFLSHLHCFLFFCYPLFPLANQVGTQMKAQLWGWLCQWSHLLAFMLDHQKRSLQWLIHSVGVPCWQFAWSQLVTLCRVWNFIDLKEHFSRLLLHGMISVRIERRVWVGTLVIFFKYNDAAAMNVYLFFFLMGWAHKLMCVLSIVFSFAFLRIK